MKIQKKNWGVSGREGGGGQGGCEQRIEVFVKIKKKKTFWGGRVGGSGGRVGVGGVRVDVNVEEKFS